MLINMVDGEGYTLKQAIASSQTQGSATFSWLHQLTVGLLNSSSIFKPNKQCRNKKTLNVAILLYSNHTVINDV